MHSTTGGALYQIEVLGPSGPVQTRNRMTVTTVTGEAVAELSLAPTPFVSRAMSALRKACPAPVDFRLDAIKRAGEAYARDTVAGLAAAEYELLVARTSGLGISEIRAAARMIGSAAADIWEWTQFARPRCVAASQSDAAVSAGTGLWVRRGSVLGMHASGNHPGVHFVWLAALALGYRVAVRPSRREPFTAHRLVSALWDSGFAHDQLVMLPSEYAAADEMIAGSDLAVVFGGRDVIDKYRDADLLAHGPGRSKILITADADWREYVELVVDSASRGGGAGCNNATSVLVEGDRSTAIALARAVADRLVTIPSLPPESEAALLPVHSIADARRIEALVLESARGSTAVLGGDGIIDDLGDGSAVLRPAVHVFDTAEDVQSSGVELAFPCLWFAPWSKDDGVRSMRNTLNLVIIGGSDSLIEAALDDPSIRNVYAAAVPTLFGGPRCRTRAISPTF
jgi:acyl-CoA reductase-like NAD-dependent aldehyde dehydrogenase